MTDEQQTERSLHAAAAYFRAGLRIGVVAPAEVVRWADGVIERLAHPPVALIDVSLARPDAVNDLSSALGALLGAPDDEPLESVHALLDRLRSDHAGGRRSLAATVRSLYALSHSAGLPDELRWKMVALEDDHALAVEGVMGSVGETEAAVRAFLAPFEGALAALLGPESDRAD